MDCSSWGVDSESQFTRVAEHATSACPHISNLPRAEPFFPRSNPLSPRLTRYDAALGMIHTVTRNPAIPKTADHASCDRMLTSPTWDPSHAAGARMTQRAAISENWNILLFLPKQTQRHVVRLSLILFCPQVIYVGTSTMSRLTCAVQQRCH
jgi:hypothetical protein